LPIVALAATMGVWLFFVQHQFEATTWDGATDWRQPEAALHGSSHYDLPPALRWFSANIGVHHVHHLSSGVPFYRLPEVLRTYPELSEVGRLTLWRSLACVRLALWEEEKRRLLSFREARARLSPRSRAAMAVDGGSDDRGQRQRLRESPLLALSARTGTDREGQQRGGYDPFTDDGRPLFARSGRRMST
jgi:hypothetical protein